MNTTLLKTKAFTLVELLVVMAIIGVLISISIVGITQVQKQQRDTTRLTDINNIKIKLEAFRGQYNRYPSGANNEIQISADGSKISFFTGTTEYDSIKISQPGLTGTLIRDSNGFCTSSKATSDQWSILYETGNTARPQDYALKACLETGASTNLGNRTVD